MHHHFKGYFVDVKWGGGRKQLKGKPQHAIDIRLLALCDTIYTTIER